MFSLGTTYVSFGADLNPLKKAAQEAEKTSTDAATKAGNAFAEMTRLHQANVAAFNQMQGGGSAALTALKQRADEAAAAVRQIGTSTAAASQGLATVAQQGSQAANAIKQVQSASSSASQAVSGLASAFAGIGAQIQRAFGGLGSAGSSLGSGISRAVAGVATETGRVFSGIEQQASRAFSAIGSLGSRAFGGLQSAARGLLSTFGDIAKVAAGVTLGNLATQGINQIQNLVTGVVRGGVAFNAFKEQAGTAFTSILKDGAAGQKMLADLWGFAAHTPFSFEPITQAAQRLLALGFAAKDVLPELKAIGDAVSSQGGSEDVFNRVVLALGQMQAKGKAAGDEMLQLTEANIPAWKYLAQAIGTDIPTAMKLVSKGAIDSATAIKAINAGVEREFGGMAEAQSRTWSGLINTMGDLWKQFTGTVLAQGFERARAGLITLTTLMDSPGFQAFGERLGAGIGNTLDVIGNALHTIAPAARATFDAFRDLAGLVGGPFAGSLGNGADRLNTFRAIVQLASDSVVTFIQAIRGNWGGQVDNNINAIVRGFGVLGQNIRQLATSIPGWLSQAWSGLVAGAQSALGALGGIWDRTLRPLADGALVWGRNIVVQLANGIVAGVGAVVQALGFIGGIITSWLQPHSPPKLLPELANWGAEAATLYMQGWTKGDFSAFDDLSGQLEGLIRSLADVGQIPQEGIIPMILTGRTDLAWIQEMIRTTGTVTKEFLDKLVADAGPAGEAMRALVQDYADVAKAQREVDDAQRKSDEATRKVTAAQRDLNAITREYAGVLGPLQDQLDALTEKQQQLSDAQRSNSLADQLTDLSDPTVQRLKQIDEQQQQLRDDQRRAELNKTIAESDDPAKVAQAKLELERLTLEAQRRQVEEQRAARDADLKRQQLELQIQESRTKQAIDGVKEEERAATSAARARLDQAKTEQQAAQDTLQAMQETLSVAKDRYDAQKALIAEQEKSNSLVKEQTALLEAQAKAAEAAAKAATTATAGALPKGATGGAGGAGGAGGIGFSLPANIPLVPPGGGFVPPAPAAFTPPTLPGLTIPTWLGGPSQGQPTGSGVGITQGGAGEWGQAAGAGGGPFAGLIASLDEVKTKFATVQQSIADQWGRLTPVFNGVKAGLMGVRDVLREIGTTLQNPASTTGRNIGAIVGGVLGAAGGAYLGGPLGAVAGGAAGAAGGAYVGGNVAPQVAGAVGGFFAPTPVPPTPTFGPTPGVTGPGKSPFEGLIPDGLDAAIHGLIDGVTTLGDAIRSGLVGAFTVFKSILGPVMADLKSTGPQWVQIGQDIVAIWGAVSPILETVAKVIGGALVVAIGIAVSTIAGLVEGFSKALPGALQFFHGQIQVALGIINFFKDEVGLAFQLLKDVVTGHWGRLGADLSDGWHKLVGDLGQITQGLRDMVEGAFLALVGAVGGYVEGFVKTLYGFFDQIYKDTTGKTTSLKDEVVKSWDTLRNTVTKTAGDFFSDLGTKVTTFKNDFVSAFESLPAKIGAAMTSLKDQMLAPLRTARDGTQSFITGVMGAVGALARVLGIKIDASPFQLPGFAGGVENWRGGAAWVGERGPEIMYVPQGATIVPSGESMALARAGAMPLPGFADGLNSLPGISGLIDFFRNTPEALVKKAFAAAGVSAPGFPGELSDAGSALLGKVTGWVVDQVKAWIKTAIPVSPESVSKMVQFADSQSGLPYIWGGGHGGAGGPGVGWDCSGFVAAVLNAGGIPNPGGIVTDFWQWATTGRSGVVDLGFISPDNPDPAQQHTGIGLLGQWYESGGQVGGAGRTSDYFPIIGHPPSINVMNTAKASGPIDFARSLANQKQGIEGQWSKGLIAMAAGGTLNEPVLGIGTESGLQYLMGEAGREFVIPADVLPLIAQYFRHVIATGDAEHGLVGIPLDMRDPLQRLARDFLNNGPNPYAPLSPGTTIRTPLYGGQALTRTISARARGRGLDSGGGAGGPATGLPPPPPSQSSGAGGTGGGAGGGNQRVEVHVTGELVARWPDGRQTVTTITADHPALHDLTDAVMDEVSRQGPDGAGGLPRLVPPGIR